MSTRTDLADRIAANPRLARLGARCRVDLRPAHRTPSPQGMLAATIVAIALSLGADAALVEAGTSLWPATSGYAHFSFGDYGKLTVVGVLVACAAWPVVVRSTSLPRWLFSRLAVVVSVVLLLPDLAIWLQGQPGRAVIVLACMHLAIAVVTYSSLVLIAPPRSPRRRTATEE